MDHSFCFQILNKVLQKCQGRIQDFEKGVAISDEQVKVVSCIYFLQWYCANGEENKRFYERDLSIVNASV